jgi:hypothetical protein
MKETPQEIEQDTLLRNWLDGLEPLDRATIEATLTPISALSTVDAEYLESFPDPDSAFDVDRPEWKLAEDLCLGLEDAEKVYAWHLSTIAREVEWAKAEQLSHIVTVLLGRHGQKMRATNQNIRVLVNALALATGLSELNGTHSQAQVARELGVTRSLMSYYVTTWADLLKINVFKFRKGSSSRETYRASATKSWAKRKEK